MNTTTTRSASHRILQSLTCPPVIASVVLIALVSITPASAQTYKEVKRLGTSQAICKPGIETAQELQQFFIDESDTVRQILDSAEFDGDPEDLFAAVAAGRFEERSYAPGQKFDWMSAKQSGQPVALPYRVWAGNESFSAFTINLTSQCRQYELVLPKVCCNLSLAGVREPELAPPPLTSSVEDGSLKVCSDPNAVVTLINPDGSRRTLPLDDSGCWTGPVSAGSYQLQAVRDDGCGPAATETRVVAAAAEPVPVAKPNLFPFIAPFVGTETRMRFEPAWNMDMHDSTGVVGIRLGLMKPLTRRLTGFVQAAYLVRDDINEGNVFADDSVLVDIGVDTRIGSKGFVGGGLGVSDLTDSEYRDLSVFVHGGIDLGDTPLQLFVEGRLFADDFDLDDNKQISVGFRYLFR